MDKKLGKQINGTEQRIQKQTHRKIVNYIWKKKQGQSSWAKIISLTNGIETKGNPLEIHFKKINPDT